MLAKGVRARAVQTGLRAGQSGTIAFFFRQTDETAGGQTIRWMNVTRYLKARKNKKSRQIVFQGEKLDRDAVWRVWDEFFPRAPGKKRKR